MKTFLQWNGVLYAVIGVGACWASGPTGIKLDGTIGPSAAALAGPSYNITQNLGKLSGGNLFFSFQYLNVATGETALFSTTSAGINNVISRVTGGYASTIDGTIALQAVSGTPNFFLINPSGVTFTSNAVVDVPAAFYVSTANYLKFRDGNFYVDPSRMSKLSMASLEAFGFLGTTRAPVNLSGALLQGGNNGEADFQIAAGDVTIDGGGASAGIANTTGNIRVTAVGSTTGEVPLSGQFTASGGTLTVRNGAELSTQAQAALSGGDIDISTGALVVDDQGLGLQSGVITYAGNTAKAGAISIRAGNDAAIINGGVIGSETFESGNAGQVQFQSGSLKIDGVTALSPTGILNISEPGSSGSAGSVSVEVAGNLSIANGGAIAAVTLGVGNAGQVQVQSESLTIDGGASMSIPTGIFGSARAGSTGLAGDVMVNIKGNATILDGGQIASNALGTGDAGEVQANFGALTIDGRANTSAYATEMSSTASAGSAGTVVINVTGGVSIINGGRIAADSSGAGTGGDITLNANSLLIDAQNSHETGVHSGGTSAGEIIVDVIGSAVVTNGGQISLVSTGPGNAGEILLQVGSLTVGALSTISAAAVDALSSGGEIDITAAGNISILNQGIIGTFLDQGAAGGIRLKAQSLTINSGGLLMGSNGVSPNAGSEIVIDVSGDVSISDGSIGSDTQGEGAAPQIQIRAASLVLNNSVISSSTTSSGVGGDITIDVTGNASLLASTISTNTVGTGAGGQITLRAGSLTIDGDTIVTSSTFGVGSAGNIVLNVSGGTSILNGSELTTDTSGAGDAGQIKLQSGSLTISGGGAPYLTGISSSAEPGSTGAAGDVTANVAGNTFVVSSGQISSSANQGSGGQAGRIIINSGGLVIASNGSISISNDAVVSNPSPITATQITVTAGQIDLNNGLITAASTGNVGASAVDIHYGSSLRMDPSTISTSSQDGNAGPIAITGQGPLLMSHSNVTTSVLGTSNGNGGNISISVPEIVLDTGIIQANTAAPRASGGDVSIITQALIPSFQNASIGGNQPITFDPFAIGLNVVQAAAPNGVSGTLSVTVPTLNLGNELLGLTGRPSASPMLGHDLCSSIHGNSLSISGRGGVAPTAYDSLWIDPEETWRESVAGNRKPSGNDDPSGSNNSRLTAIACR